MLTPFRSAASSWSFVLSAVLVAACSSDPAQPTGAAATGTTGSGGTAATGASTSGGDAASTTASGTTGTGAAELVCDPPGYKPTNPEKLAIGKVTATIVDLEGNPAPNVVVFVCGTDICSLPGTSDAAGAVALSVNATEVDPAFKYGDARTFAKLLIPVKAGDTDFGTLTTGALPSVGADFVPGKSAISGEDRK